MQPCLRSLEADSIILASFLVLPSNTSVLNDDSACVARAVLFSV